jgi:hypothetical protein
VLRYWLKDANDPPSPGLWKPMPDEYAIGFAGTYRNTDGGVALGYGYGPDGTINTGSCDAALWTTGQNLRNNPALRSQLEPGGPLVVNGLQGSPADMVRSANEPPAVSYFVDYDDRFDDPSASGHMGSVRILARPCAGQVADSGSGRAGSSSSPPLVSGPQTATTTTPGCIGPNCGPPPKACFASTGTFECVKGHWVYNLTVTGPGWINSVNAISLTSGVIVAGGSFPLNPASIPVFGTPGSTATIEICAFNAAAAASGKPYECCRTKMTVTIPKNTCGGIK